MRFTEWYKNNRDKWWGLPLVLPLLLLPLARDANTFVRLDNGVVALYYMPLALLLSMMLFFGWEALPGIVLGVWCVIARGMSLADSFGVTLHFLIPIVLSWGGYRIFAPRRHHVSHGTPRLMAQRLFWQMFFPSSVFQLLLQFAVFFGMLPVTASMSGIAPFTLNSLINYQALLVGCLTGVPLCYFIIRVIRNPRHLRGFISQLLLQIDKKVSPVEIIIWVIVLLFVLSLLLMPMTESSTIFSTNYTLSLLLPVMLWGSMRFGYRFMSVLWTSILIISIHYYYRYIPDFGGNSSQMAITSSSYLVFSFIVVYTSMLATQQRLIHQRVKRMAFIDPLVHMPNLRALSRALAATPWSVICFLRIPELEVLGRHYGMMLRIQYKQTLAQWLNDFLQPGECVYQMSGHDLVIRMNTDAHQKRIEALDILVKKFRFIWDGMPLQPNVGISYCYVRSPVLHLPLLLGELSTIADLSLTTSHPESLQRSSAMRLQQRLKDKIAMMNRLQLALEEGRFRLMAQPIVGIRGDDYYEILLRMVGDQGELIGPDAFLPVAHEFGLSSRIDMWVVENTLRFMSEHRDALPGLRLSINLSPSSVCNTHFPRSVEALLATYGVEAWQLIFEITESQSLNHPAQAYQTLEQLHLLGCRIAIDDFGTGYASYARLKEVNADILKIDGSFIRNLASSSLDHQIVTSICHLARMKKMQVVAEYVETEEMRAAAIALGIDYLQGYCIGKPAPLEALVAADAPPKPSGSGDIW
ncbi:EAL domain-containing protein [[Enterobacter] lignolyticus]|uniref:Diguanylate cyclase/phosphodiesterase n=1 Tax=Enterobacter lignolyticus (strain SCF1) TaxID=701347 RepID=E3G8Q7_ENTLS|nr:EAL domain-containing protein [[Enterobacter] lignolyticus]ADO47535.1 diguanylate cyclase/phosphodiesterase [[Enterobacter] lignolyticus SCF1]